jgi:hypothetical protein
MEGNFQLDSGPRYLKPAIFGSLAIVFAGGVFAMIHSGESTAPRPAAGAAESTVLADSAEPAANDPAMSPDAAATVESAGIPVPAAAGSDSSAMTVAATEPAPVAAPPAESAVTPAPEPTAAPAPSAPTVAAAPVAEAPAAQPEVAMNSPSQAAAATEKVAPRDEQPNRPAVRPETAAASDALRPWWQPAGEERFGVQYVGQAADQQTMVFRFSRQVSNPVAAENIKLLTENGQAVAANFQPGQDPRVLIVPNLEPGRYTVMIDPKLASTSGETLGTPLHGPTFIQSTVPATEQASTDGLMTASAE